MTTTAEWKRVAEAELKRADEAEAERDQLRAELRLARNRSGHTGAPPLSEERVLYLSAWGAAFAFEELKPGSDSTHSAGRAEKVAAKAVEYAKWTKAIT